LALRRNHINLETGVVRVEVQAVELTNGTRVVTAPKTEAGTRSVHLPAMVNSAMKDHIEFYGPSHPMGLLFKGPLAEGLRRSTFYKEWDKARRAVDHPELHFHDLRHAAGTLAAQTGATLREIMARLGHASPVAAQRYQHAAERRDQVIADALDLVLEAATKARKGANGHGPRDARGMESQDDAPPAAPLA
jgi:integrase